MPVEPDATYTHTENITWRDVNDEVVVLDLKSGEYYTMNQTGQCIWRALMEGKTVDQVKDLVLERFQVEKDKALTDVEEFISGMMDKGLLYRTEKL